MRHIKKLKTPSSKENTTVTTTDNNYTILQGQPDLEVTIMDNNYIVLQAIIPVILILRD